MGRHARPARLPLSLRTSPAEIMVPSPPLPEDRRRRGERAHVHLARMSLSASAERGDWVEELLGSPAMAFFIKVEAVTLE